MYESTSFCAALAQSPHMLFVILRQPAVSWHSILSTLATPTIAAFGIWIAYQQWSTARSKIKIDLYEKRLVVYEAARIALGDIVTSDKTTNEIEIKYLIGIAGAGWLFNEKLNTHLKETLWHEIVHLGTLQSQLDAIQASPERKSIFEKKSELKSKLNDRLIELDYLFHKFMHISVEK